MSQRFGIIQIMELEITLQSQLDGPLLYYYFIATEAALQQADYVEYFHFHTLRRS